MSDKTIRDKELENISGGAQEIDANPSSGGGGGGGSLTPPDDDKQTTPPSGVTPTPEGHRDGPVDIDTN